MGYSVLSPFVIPPELRRRKRVNVGDGFILDAIQKLLAPHRCEFVLTTRRALTDEETAQVNSTKALILAGANLLSDDFQIARGMDRARMNRIHVPIVPFGIGASGVPQQNREMSASAREVLRAIHERTRFSGWRCVLTLRYLSESLPELADHFLMTGCPVQYGEPILTGAPFPAEPRSVAVTVTERHEFWERETATLDFVARRFGSCARHLVLHEVFRDPPFSVAPQRLRKFFQTRGKTPSALRKYAAARGFQVVLPDSVDQCLSLYRSCDWHIGSRVHAHLYFLSQARKTFLTRVDDRSTGFAMTLGFPLCDPAHLEQHLDFDFEICRAACRQHYAVMQQFVSHLKSEVL